MKKSLLIILILIILGISWYATRDTSKDDYRVQQTQTGSPQEPGAGSTSGEIFEGTVTAYDTACFADGICSVTVGGKTVILAMGRIINGEPEPAGQLVGVESIGDLEQKIGSRAEVYAKKISENEYTLYGNSAYFVKIK